MLTIIEVIVICIIAKALVKKLYKIIMEKM